MRITALRPPPEGVPGKVLPKGLRKLSAKLMANRSDRRLTNLSNSLALEAVEPIGTRRADFDQGPERRTALLIEAGYTIATGSAFTPANNFARGAGSIYESSNSLRGATMTEAAARFSCLDSVIGS
jgi:hypothetical protein